MGDVRERRPGGPDLRGSVQDLHVLERPLPATPAAAALARMTARVACRAWRVPHVADDGVLLASELVTAATAATAGLRIVLRLRMTPRRLRIEAHDPTGRLTLDALEDAGDDRVCLDPVQQELLHGLACRCGAEPSGPGTQVWVELPLGPGAAR